MLEIDSLVYPSELQGTFKSVSERYHQNRDSYVLVLKDELIVGYLCFFPISAGLYDSMKLKGSFFDDDIEPEQIQEYSDSNDLFFISVAVRPQFQDGEAIILLCEGVKKFLLEKERNGNAIRSLNAYITSPGGAKLVMRFGMKKIYDIDKSYAFFSADRQAILRFCHG